MMATPGTVELLADRLQREVDKAGPEWAYRSLLIEAIAALRRAAKSAEDGVLHCMLQNQIEIMSALSLLLRYSAPKLVGLKGELDQQRDDLLQRHKATQAALTEQKS